jgi:hypothetical protein
MAQDKGWLQRMTEKIMPFLASTAGPDWASQIRRPKGC